MTKKASNQLNDIAPNCFSRASGLRSQAWFSNPANTDMTAIYLERTMNFGLSLDELQSGRPIIGIAQTGSDIAPCNRHHVELAVLDAAGRLQIPREYLEEFEIKRRVLIETTADGILIRKPDGNHQGEHGTSSSEQVEADAKREALQTPSSWSKMWQSVKSRFTRGLKK